MLLNQPWMCLLTCSVILICCACMCVCMCAVYICVYMYVLYIGVHMCTCVYRSGIMLLLLSSVINLSISTYIHEWIMNNFVLLLYIIFNPQIPYIVDLGTSKFLALCYQPGRILDVSVYKNISSICQFS